VGSLTRFFVLAAGLLATTGALAQTDSVPEADAQAIRSIIEAQLAAFSDDDAEKAFSFASEGIQKTFGSPENFMVMVKTSYPVVYRPATVVFLEPVQLDDEVVQRVQMADDADRLWLALYRMQRQPDKSWRIGGCVLKSLEGSRS
jgi:hypothetical protein